MSFLLFRFLLLFVVFNFNYTLNKITHVQLFCCRGCDNNFTQNTIIISQWYTNSRLSSESPSSSSSCTLCRPTTSPDFLICCCSYSCRH